jgi:hypothetical protein
MHPDLLQTVAAEHVRDMRTRAAAAQRVKMARRSRRDRNVAASAAASAGAPVRSLGAAAGSGAPTTAGQHGRRAA